MNGSAGRRILPDRLSAIPDRWYFWLRPCWLLVFALALLADAAGIAYAVHDNLETRPLFNALGLATGIDDDGSVLVDPLGEEAHHLGIVPESRIVAIEDRPVPPGTLIDVVAERLRDTPGDSVRIAIAAPDGETAEYRLVRSPVHVEQAEADEPIPGDARWGIRLAFSVLGCATLLLCAVLLFLRRPRDPVAMLLSFAFLLLAATIDPPLMMWLALGFGDPYDAVSSSGWVLLIVALAAFPDGRFDPRWLRWTIPAAPPLAVLLSIDEVDPLLQILIGIGIPLALLGMQVVRYRRLEPGIARQQIKWAAFGFASGFLLVGIAVALAIQLEPERSALYSLMLVVMFSLGFILIPLGLMVSLVRFRLWEADTIISRSAAYAVVTLVVGIVWAASTDLVRGIVTSMLGEHSAAAASTMSAVVAAGVFAPTQAVVLGWTKRHFGKDSNRLRTLPERLAAWRTTETPAEIGMRSLAVIAESIHAASAALLELTPTGNALVAARDVADPEALAEPGGAAENDARFPLRLPVADEDGPVGLLLVGPRSDGNRYNRDERAALEAIAEPLAEAVRFARRRTEREEGMARMISAVEQRIAQLEGGREKPEPA